MSDSPASIDGSQTRRTPERVSIPQDLPIAAHRDAIAAALQAHQVVIVAGETGSGKTTQLPKICLDLGRGALARIGHTQPRRLAARTVAARIAEELGTQLGALVGYQVRFTDQVSEATAIKLMTDGVLLAEMQHDRWLRQYDTLIIDEAHERSLNIDFLLGYLKRILPKRPDLKVIVTSATIDVERFSKHFDSAPIIEVSGRGYPVETYHLDALGEEELGQRVLGVVQEIDAQQYGQRGDVLVFLSGEREIRELAQLLRRHTQLDVLPLYARLGQSEQNRVFSTHSARGQRAIRVVLATNVAETSLTVPGIRYVIDSGEARISRYSHRSKLQRLPVEAISQASADQRRGRCGRVGPGVCLRLYSEADYLARPEFTEPEIHRTNLASVVLRMLQLGLGEAQHFPFVEPPDGRLLCDGYRLLDELGAIDARQRLTGIGQRMAQLPIDPRLARMVLAGADQGVLQELLVICSALSVQDPRERPPEKQQRADQSHARFADKRSDFMAWLALWEYVEGQRQALSQNRWRKQCQREFLSHRRLREWRDVHRQLTIAVRQQRLHNRREVTAEQRYAAIHTALLTGLLGNIAQHDEAGDYRGTRNRSLRIFPGSSQARAKPKWIVAAEIVETSRVYAREVAAIDPRWVLAINPRLLKHHYSEPHWRAKRGQVVAQERVSLYGLHVVERRSVHYGPIEPRESRALMIREGLIPGALRPLPAFLQHNLQEVALVEKLEAKTRRRDLLVDEEVLFAFYDERLPEDLFTANRLRSYLKKNPRADASLRLGQAQLLAQSPAQTLDAQFPEHLHWQDMRFALTYEFEPGSAADGVSVTIPVAALNRAPLWLFEWLVPGLLAEKCIELVRALPKDIRKRLVPVPDTVQRALADLQPADVSLVDALSAVLAQQHGIAIQAADFDAQALPDYYRMNIKVVDANGRLLEQGRDLRALVAAHRDDTRRSVSQNNEASPAREGLTRWDFDALPSEWRLSQASVDILAYPALVDRRDAVDICLCDYPMEAQRQHRWGVLRLLRLASAQPVKYLRKQLLKGNAAALALAAAQRDRGDLVDDLIDAAFLRAALPEDAALPREREAFQSILGDAQRDVVNRAIELEHTLLLSLTTLGDIRAALQALPPEKWLAAREDIHGQLAGLLQTHFMRDTPAQWLDRYPRYLQALAHRLERLPAQPAQDAKHTALLEELSVPLVQVLKDRPAVLLDSPELSHYRWMLEEFRVSLFAQRLGTKMPVSEKRLRSQWSSATTWLENNPF